MRDLPSYSFTADGRTVVPLRFESQESYFVAFRRKATGAPLEPIQVDARFDSAERARVSDPAGTTDRRSPDWALG